jgi:cytoskeletal protein RodZ
MKEFERIDPNASASNLTKQLRQKRLEKRMSFEVLAEHMKIPAAKIEELEAKADALDLSPFDRGHLRNLAAILEVDMSQQVMTIKQMEKTYSALKTIDQKNLNLQAPRNTRWLVSLFVIMVLVVAVYFIIDLLA